MEAFNYPKPHAPLHLAQASRQFGAIADAINAALRGDLVGLEQAERLALHLVHRTPLNAEQRDAEDRYWLEVRKYNEAALAYNERLRAERQARVNARQVAQVRVAACKHCFATHAGDC
jgi:hypothetical protein